MRDDIQFLDGRRRFLRGAGAVAALSLLASGPLAELVAPAAAAAEAAIPLRLVNVNTNEAYDVELFTGGQWNPNALVVCDYLMRDWRQKASTTCDRKIYASLYVMQRYFAPTERIRIHSGYRTDATNRLLREMGYNPAVNSQHLKAKAVDFSIAGADLRSVAKAVKALQLGGTGLYLDDGFVHLDTRGAAAQWGDSF